MALPNASGPVSDSSSTVPRFFSIIVNLTAFGSCVPVTKHSLQLTRLQSTAMEHQEEVLDIEIASVSGTSESQSDSLSVAETSQPSGSQAAASQDQEPFQNPWPHLERYFKLSRQDKDNEKVLYFECQKCRQIKKIVRGHVTGLNNLKSHIKRTHPSIAIQFEEIKAGSGCGKCRHHTSGNSSVRNSGSTTSELPANKVRQPTIGEALGSASTGTAVRQSTVDDKIVRLFVNNILQRHVVESEEFVDLVRTLNPTKVSLSRHTLGRRIDDKQRAVEEALINTFDWLTYLATTADCWTAHNRSFLGMTAHWIDPTTRARKHAYCPHLYPSDWSPHL
uniref:BED-type domain-containing protein n=1 Tax=Eptatretus burgeri TaxID=7764 RepID=A0A8C4RA82_EPTBU